MAVTEQRRVGLSGETDTRESLVKRASNILKGVTTEKAMRLFNRTVGDNVKLDKFLSGKFTLPKAFDPDTVNATIDRLIKPETLRNPHNHYGLIAVEEQRALLNVLVDEKVSEEVAIRTQWLRGFKLNEEQDIAAGEALKAYEKTLRAAIKSVSRWKQVYGTRNNQE